MQTPEPSWLLLGLAVAVVLALLALVGWLAVTEPAAVLRRWGGPAAPPVQRGPVTRTVEAGSQQPGQTSVAPRLQRAAVVVNPTKFDDVERVRQQVARVCRRHGWAEPLWLQTTVEDPGPGQARCEVEEGVDVVCSLGGDGTVRAVASALIGTGTPLGLLPGGTGNLLARNLNLPIDSLERALDTALTGRDKAIDSCTLTLRRPTTAELAERLADEEGEPTENVDLTDAADAPSGPDLLEEHRFLVIAGLGFDAEVMAGAPEGLKAKVGWAAYLVSGLRHLRGPQFMVDVTTDDGLRLRRRVRSVMVGNVGKLTGGVTLLPRARLDDGIMDMVLLSPQGVVGWAAAGVQIATRQRRGHYRVDHHTCREVTVRAQLPVEIQLDGDTMGNASAMRIAVNPASLLVRVPR